MDPLSVSVEVRSRLLWTALGPVLRSGGLRLVDGPSTVVVTDSDSSSRARHGPVLLIVTSGGAAARLALDELLQGRIAGAVPEDDLEMLVPAVHAVAAGLRCVAPRLLEIVAALPSITTRQRDVLELLTAGKSNGDIAAELFVSEATVKRDIARLLRAYGAGNRQALARLSGLAS